MENAVTLYLQGHGLENINQSFNNDQTLELLSFVGMPGVLGQMGFCDYNDKPIDVNIIEFLHNQYYKQNYNLGNLNSEAQEMLFDLTPEYLPEIYKKCDIFYDKGFTKTWPRWDRNFTFKPNPHENCRLCQNNPVNELEKDKDITFSNNCYAGRCLPERNINNLFCPEYGLTIVASSFPNDLKFTLAGSKNRINSNINMSLSNKEYWKNRASNQYKYLIDQIYNKKIISLTELNHLFKSMGFQHIYIYDPTCRSCQIDKLQAEQHRSLEIVKPTLTSNVITSQPTSSIIPEMNNSSNPINSQNSYIKPFQECINGICKIFPSKSKVDGGKTKKGKVFKKRKTINKKRKTLVSKKRKTIKNRVKKP